MLTSSSKCALRSRIGFLLTAVLLAGFALFPHLTLPEPTLTRGFTDKIYHVGGCALLVILAVEGWPLARRFAGLAVPLSFGLEWLQAFVPGRGVHLADSLANVAGVSAALLLLMAFRRLSLVGRSSGEA
jgi:VanZ family protein